MLEIASQMILCLLLAALLGAIIGYILGKSTCGGDDCHENNSTDDTSHDTHGIVSTTSNTSVDTAAENISTDSHELEILTAPRNGQKDNLTRIKGVGLKIESMLNDIGIYHFDQIASWNKENVIWADKTLGFPGRVDREDWVSQAQALASGAETEFSKRVDAGEVSSSKQS